MKAFVPETANGATRTATTVYDVADRATTLTTPAPDWAPTRPRSP